MAGTLAFTGAALTAPAEAAGSRVDYSRDIRPILSDTCYKCHGPDEGRRQAKMRLDTSEGALRELRAGKFPIAPGKSGESEVYRRITAQDPDDRMPPASSGKKLTEAQIELIRRWIDEGAEWRQHWAFIKPERPEVPAASEPAPGGPHGRPEPTRNSIDRFIRARLAREGQAPSSPADAETLVRRVTLDLTGLPPTVAEVDAFLADGSLQAYDRMVDRLLDSPAYGEQMARYWLDGARYGDTHGLHFDNERSLWPYRDWVIGAFNRNLPFDTFTIEQLAGDLLPEPTLDQRIATGFNRCNITTSEGGSIDEEVYVRYTVDRVETTSTVWMALTTHCAVCHDHKFDPITQRDFYSLFAFFNSLNENAMDGNVALPPPFIQVPSREQKDALAGLKQEFQAAKESIEAPMPEVDAAETRWAAELSGRLQEMWQVLEPVHAASTGGAKLRRIDDGSLLVEETSPEKDVYEITARTNRTGITAIRLEALRHEPHPQGGPGRADNANFVLSEFEAIAASIAEPISGPGGGHGPAKEEKIAFASARADYSQKEYEISKAIDGNPATGWAIDGSPAREDRTAVFFAAQPFGYPEGTEVRFRIRQEHGGRHTIGRFRISVTADPSLAPVALGTWRVAGPFQESDGQAALKAVFPPEEHPVDLNETFAGGKLKWIRKPELVDGKVHRLEGESCATYLYRRVVVPQPRRLDVSLGSDDSLKVWLNRKLVFERDGVRGVAPDQDRITLDIPAGESQLLMKVVNYIGGYGFYFRTASDSAASEVLDVGPLLAVAEPLRTESQKKRLREHYRSNHSPLWRGLKERMDDIEKKRKGIDAQIPGTMVMEERAQKRDAFILVRGEYDRRGEKVEAGVPSFLPPLPPDAPRSRLGFSRWLVDPSHPLTARVAVNRYWQQYFGVGIVKTSEDFGSQGEWPVHPELLDWLATEFIRSGWDVKAMQRLIVSSATYRQAARVRPEHLEKDPENRLLARGPRFRLDAEAVRDSTLAASGLLVKRDGGRSVKPYQPSGIWEAVAFIGSDTQVYKQDHGDSLHRRSLYTFWKRTSPPATMALFDAPTREACTVTRARTNTPLQALALMNDVQFFEAARALAQRAIREGGADEGAQLAHAFRLATARRPRPDELEVLAGFYRDFLETYRADGKAALEVVSQGETPRDESIDAARLAAMTMVGNMILNLDETITRG